jgi:hypothetical protein
MKRLFMLLLLLCACDSPTEDGGIAINIEGEWIYHAMQITPALDMTGTFQITDQDGASFSGTASFTETDVQGTQIPRAGALSGRIIGGDVVDIDIYVDLQVRRHVGRVVLDSMGGTWSVTGAASLSGSFTARRP